MKIKFNSKAICKAQSRSSIAAAMWKRMIYYHNFILFLLNNTVTQKDVLIIIIKTEKRTKKYDTIQCLNNFTIINAAEKNPTAQHPPPPKKNFNLPRLELQSHIDFSKKTGSGFNGYKVNQFYIGSCYLSSIINNNQISINYMKKTNFSSNSINARILSGFAGVVIRQSCTQHDFFFHLKHNTRWISAIQSTKC